MRFWDSSAVVPLCVDAPEAPATRALLRSDRAMAVWWATRTECISALVRQVREGSMDLRGEREARAILTALERAWSEVQPAETVRGLAERLLATHTLRAADALQLAAALQWRGRPSAGAQFVCFDGRLRGAAHAEGFAVLPVER
jgi:predicted nucleic acid-binding protein